ncbi:MAG TPA: aminotransferase class I/II-fold pyridoxal phosphate-dependent enzyme [candidate division Zixibacteria bacterium]|nr:aminotransferase class I/II-fold pyridoxal phosphate-dependent enzyme [candidate division Zixibacteria bacterium]
MNTSEFRQHGHELIDWIADYFESIREFPVKSQVAPGDILKALPGSPPDRAEPFSEIFDDFQKKILPGMTHWQHPSFFAYFPANSSTPSVLGELLTSALAAQCMIWQTSPAAAELEEQVMEWLKQMLALPESFTGVIQDTASTATLCSILTARERISDYAINNAGLQMQPVYAVYCSSETHSSIEKAVKIAGLGRRNLRIIEVDDTFAMRPEALEDAIRKDLDDGVTPLCVIATIGTTGSTAIDPLREVGEICQKYKIWLHVDAAYAGTALLLPEMRWMSDGLELADTFVFNPHKWMATNFDCSAYFVRDKAALIRTFEILPEYLKTSEGSSVNNYRDWGVPLGRRFRALKLWFVIRSFGVSGLQEMVRRHLFLANDISNQIDQADDFERLAPTPLSLICFRYHPVGTDDPETLNRLNETLLTKLNSTGKLYMTHTKLNGAYTLRMVIAQTYVQQEDVANAWALIQETARSL